MITTQTTVSEAAAESLAAIRVFQSHGIDFCCGGHKTLAEAAQRKGLEPEALISQLQSALAGPKPDATDWNAASLRDLTAHIVERHHTYLRTELPRIQAWLDKVCSKYSDRDGEMLSTVAATYAALRAELESHLEKEELILFPWIGRFEAAIAAGNPAPALPFGRFDGPISCMEDEHEHAGDALRTLNAATNGYTAPEHACRTYRTLFEALAEFEADLHMHIHLENNILHPRAKAMFSAATEELAAAR